MIQPPPAPSVVGLQDLAIGVGSGAANAPLSVSSTGSAVAALSRLASDRALELSTLGVPSVCATYLAEAEVSAEALAALPWEVVEQQVAGVSGVGPFHMQLLRVAWDRLPRDGRSKASSRASSKRGSRSGSQLGAATVGSAGRGAACEPEATRGQCGGGQHRQSGVAFVGAPLTALEGYAGDQFAQADAAACASLGGLMPPGFELSYMPDFARAAQVGSNGGACAQLPATAAACHLHGAQAAMGVAATVGSPQSPYLIQMDAPLPAQPLSQGVWQPPLVAESTHCALPGCTRPRYPRLGGTLHECCGNEHAKALAELRLQRGTPHLPRTPSLALSAQVQQQNQLAQQEVPAQPQLGQVGQLGQLGQLEQLGEPRLGQQLGQQQHPPPPLPLAQPTRADQQQQWLPPQQQPQLQTLQQQQGWLQPPQQQLPQAAGLPANNAAVIQQQQQLWAQAAGLHPQQQQAFQQLAPQQPVQWSDPGMLRAQLTQVSPGAAAPLFAVVPDDRLFTTVMTGMTLFQMHSSLQGDVSGVALLANLIEHVVAHSSVTVDSLLRDRAGVADPVSRVMVVMQELASAHSRAGPTRLWAAGGAAGSAPSDEASSVRRAIESVGRDPVAAAQVQKLRTAVSGGVTTPEQDETVLRMVRDLEAGEHGADVAMILHQEKLGAVPTGMHSVSAAAAAVWGGMGDVMSWVARARERQMKLQLPAAVDAKALVASVAAGKFSVDKLVPGKLVGAERGRMILLGWPAFVELVSSVYPRDPTAGATLRQLTVEAFGGGSDDAAHGLLERTLKQAATSFEGYRSGSDPLPTWKSIRDQVRDDLDAASLTRRALEATQPRANPGDEKGKEGSESQKGKKKPSASD